MKRDSFENLGGRKREIFDMADDIQKRVHELLNCKDAQSRQFIEIEKIEEEINAAVEACIDGKSLAGFTGKLKAIESRIRQRETKGRGNPLYSNQKPPLSNNEFSKLRRDFWKTILEVFVAPEDRTALPENVDVKNAIKYLAIDPARITNGLLENLGMPRKNFKNTDECVIFIKKFLTRLGPLKISEYYKNEIHRFYKLNESGDLTGMLIGTQRRGENKHFYMTDLYGAVMRQKHIIQSEADTPLLYDMGKIIAEIEDEINGADDWPEFKKAKEKNAENIIKRLDLLISLLDKAINTTKLKISQKLSGASITDSRGRDNPSAFLAKLVSVRQHLIPHRKNEIAEIKGYIAHDESVLLDKLRQHYAPFEDFYKEITEAEFLKKNAELNEDQRKKIGNLVYSVKQRMPHAEFQPFLKWAQDFTKNARVFFFLKKKNPQTTPKRILMNMFLIAKAEHIYKMFERLHYRISLQKEASDVCVVVAKIDEIEKIIEDRSVMPDIKTNLEKWRKFRKMTQEIRGIVKEKQNLQKEKLLEEVKKYLSEKLKIIDLPD